MPLMPTMAHAFGLFAVRASSDIVLAGFFWPRRPSSHSETRIGKPISAIQSKYTNTKAAPPLSPTIYGNFQIFPRPTAEPAAASTKVIRDDHCACASFAIHHPLSRLLCKSLRVEHASFRKMESLLTSFSKSKRNLSDQPQACQLAHLKRWSNRVGFAFHRQRAQAGVRASLLRVRYKVAEPCEETHGYLQYAQIRKGFSPDLSTALDEPSKR